MRGRAQPGPPRLDRLALFRFHYTRLEPVFNRLQQLSFLMLDTVAPFPAHYVRKLEQRYLSTISFNLFPV